MYLDKDSVVNFLTPKKLVQTSIKSKPRSNLQDPLRNDSYTSDQLATSNTYAQNTSNLRPYSFTANFDKEVNRSRHQSQEAERTSMKEKSRPPTDRISVVSNSRSKEEENYKIPSQESFKIKVYDQKHTEQDHYDKYTHNSSVLQLQPVDYAPVGEVLAKINNSQKSSRVRESRHQSDKGREDYDRGIDNKNTFKLEGSVQDLKRLMAGLRQVKESINEQLSQLQRLLDNTSSYLNDINQQYLKIKERILKYTSQVLDASFTKYRENMVDWMKYEEVEKKAIAIIAQLDKHIIEDEIVVREIVKAPNLPRVAIDKQREIAEKVDFYTNFCHEMATIRKDCLSNRPHLRKERILNFEKALAFMAQF